VDTYSILWPIHAILMGVSFLLILSGMMISRYGKKKKWWLKTHRSFGSIGSIGAVAALILAVVMISVTHGYHLSNTHGIFGLITVVLLLVTPFMGYWMTSPKGGSAEVKKKLRVIHRWIGRVTILFMAVTTIFGLQLSGIL
jgi:protein-S-isoprenylcysteine O-methyltransferase Ste14